jgi:hypothetical protein
MGDLVAGYEAVHSGFYTFSQNFFEPAIFIPLVLLFSVVGVAVMVVKLDGDPHQHAQDFLDASYFLLYVLPVLLFGIWFYRGGANFLLDVASHTWNIILIVVGFFTALIAILLMAIFPLVLVVCYVVLGYSLVRGAPHLALVLVDASVVIGRGLGTVLHVPYRVMRSAVYHFKQPPALKEMKRVTQAKDARPDDIAQAHRAVRDEFTRVNRATKKELSNFSVRAFAHHYHKFADTLSAQRARVLASYNRGVARTAKEVRQKVEESHARHERNDD